jgi:endonuclease/exonuclease/phosphatase family metal-dependent hydrolase
VRRAAIGLLALSVLAGCGGGDAPPPALTVMTQNAYVGGDVSRLVTARTPEAAEQAVSELFAEVEASDVPARAAALAGAIAAAEPDLVALQEVALWRTQSPADGSATPATTVAFDMLAALLDALDELGLAYEPVTVVEAADVEAPAGERDVRLTDREVILAARQLVESGAVEATGGARYARAVLAQSPFGGTIEVPRAWASVDLRVAGRALRLVSTHLEVQAFEHVQAAQAAELLAGPAAADVPVLLVGDVNSDARGASTATYPNLLAAGFTDAWPADGGPGGTCCHDGSLREPPRALDQRIDVVLLRGAVRATAAEVIGEEGDDRTDGGLWPSDHAGVVASIVLA